MKRNINANAPYRLPSRLTFFIVCLLSFSISIAQNNTAENPVSEEQLLFQAEHEQFVSDITEYSGTASLIIALNATTLNTEQQEFLISRKARECFIAWRQSNTYNGISSHNHIAFWQHFMDDFIAKINTISPQDEALLITAIETALSKHHEEDHDHSHGSNTQAKEIPTPQQAPGDMCTNPDFELCDYTNWILTTGDVNAATGPFSFENPQLTNVFGTVNALGFNLDEHNITNGGVDPNSGEPMVFPGGTCSSLLGNGDTGGADAVRIEQTFLVDPSSNILTMNYHVILEDPNHQVQEQPYFRIRVFDENDNIIDCASYEAFAGDGQAGWTPYYAFSPFIITGYYLPWTTVLLPLDQYIGQNIRVEVTVGDCTLGAHPGYAYVDFSCTPLEFDLNGSGSCSGPFTLSVPAGASTYLWNTGATTPSISVNNPGYYSVDIIPITGSQCSITIDTVLAAWPTLITDALITNPVVCEGEPTFIYTDSTDVNLTHTWTLPDGSQVTGNSINIGAATPTNSGMYFLLTTDVTNGCTAIDSIDLLVNPIPIIQVNDGTLCPGGNVTLTATGADTYTWDNGLGTGATQNVTPPVTTTYTVTGTDANGCQNTASAIVTVSNNLNVMAFSDTSTCGATPVTLTATGATFYDWNNGLSNQNNLTVTPTVTTVYTVTGSDALGCSGTASVTVTILPPPVVDAGPDIEACEGTKVTLTGSGALTYVWDNNVIDGVLFEQPPSTVTYTVIGTDANGCTGTDQVTVIINPNPIVTAGPDVTVCDGNQVTLTAAGANTLVWSGGVLNGIAFTPPIGTTQYSVMGIDLNGCEGFDTVDVTINPLPTILVADTAICAGQSATLTGSGAIVYQWDNGILNGVPFTPLATATYTVIGTDANGCSNTAAAQVTIAPMDDPTFTTANFCGNSNAIPPTIQGTPGGIFSLNAPMFGASIDPNSGVLSNCNGGNLYSINYTTTGGCPMSSNQVIDVYAPPTLTAQNQVICIGELANLTVNGASNYLWDQNLGAAAQQTVSPTATTTYNVLGTDVNGCLDSMAVTVTVHPLPIVDAGTDILICDGSTVTFTATGANTYAWDNGIFNGIPFAPTQSTTYTVTGTNIYGCVDTDSVNVTVEPNPVVVFQADLLAGCEPLTTNLSNLTAGNFNDCVWVISTGDTLNGCGPLPYTFTNAGLYDVTLIVTSQHGCVGTATYADYIYVEANPIASFGAQTNGLDIFNTTLSYNNTSINAVSYIWNFNDGSSLSTDENPIHTFPELTAGTFITELVAFSELGCTDTAWMSIPIEDELLYYVPNTFTPDDDEFNQTFFPVFSGYIDPYNYTMYIYNRWGELIFESHNVDVGWDGTYAGRSVSDGTYTWKIVFKTDKTKETTAIHGHVNVIK